jgi:hypothetical protein
MINLKFDTIIGKDGRRHNSRRYERRKTHLISPAGLRS